MCWKHSKFAALNKSFLTRMATQFSSHDSLIKNKQYLTDTATLPS